MIDAPVSGGTGRAQSGELSVIVGGDAAVVAKCKDLFDVMGSQTFHVGPLGSGLAMKLVNNMLVQVNTVAVAEALVLGRAGILTPGGLAAAISRAVMLVAPGKLPRHIVNAFDASQ